MKTILKGGFVTLLLFITSVAWSQNITISGKVLENGNPLSYVTILVQGTDIGTTTERQGFSGRKKHLVIRYKKQQVITYKGFRVLMQQHLLPEKQREYWLETHRISLQFLLLQFVGRMLYQSSMGQLTKIKHQPMFLPKILSQ